MSLTPSLSIIFALYFDGAITVRLEISLMHRLRVPMASSTLAFGSWYLTDV